jgi:GDP-4-dehydro-6-deoxy-D-mannose reductase
MKALITGQAGFVGTYLAAYLEDAGDEIVAFTDSAGAPADVTHAAAVHEAFGAAPIDVVYHLAALTHVGESWDAPGEVWRVNTEGTLNVIHAATRAGARVVVVSSADAYGAAGREGLLDEATPLLPLSPYGASKAATELIAQQAVRGSNADVVVARAFNHTGPGQPPRFVVPALATRVAAAEGNGDERIIVGNLDAVRDLSHVRDVVAAYRALAEQGVAGEIYNVCSSRPVSVLEIAETFIAQATAPMKLEVDPALVRPIEVPWMVGDNNKLRVTTGWAPRLTLEETLADVLAAARTSTE